MGLGELGRVLSVRFSPPPSPPPDPTMSEVAAAYVRQYPWLGPLLSLIALSVVLGVLAAMFVRQRWRVWFDAACEDAFKLTDIDGSGRIDKEELYVGVLEMYLQLHLYGLNVRTPPRAKVLKLMEAVDDDDSGEIDREEFKEVLEVLVRQTSSRVITQIGLTILSPLTAGYVCSALKWTLGAVMAELQLSTPGSLVALGSQLPSTLDESLVTGLLMLSINPALSYSDQVVEGKAVAKKKKKKVL